MSGQDFLQQTIEFTTVANAAVKLAADEVNSHRAAAKVAAERAPVTLDVLLQTGVVVPAAKTAAAAKLASLAETYHLVELMASKIAELNAKNIDLQTKLASAEQRKTAGLGQGYDPTPESAADAYDGRPGRGGVIRDSDRELLNGSHRRR